MVAMINNMQEALEKKQGLVIGNRRGRVRREACCGLLEEIQVLTQWLSAPGLLSEL